MENMILALGWLGVFAPLALGAVGSIIGCSRAGQAAIAANADDIAFSRYRFRSDCAADHLYRFSREGSADDAANVIGLENFF